MGKTPKPLAILVSRVLANCPEIQELREKGHAIVVDNEEWARLEDYDLVLGSNCFRMFPETLKYLPTAVKGSRAVKYGGKHDRSEVGEVPVSDLGL